MKYNVGELRKGLTDGQGWGSAMLKLQRLSYKIDAVEIVGAPDSTKAFRVAQGAAGKQP